MDRTNLLINSQVMIKADLMGLVQGWQEALGLRVRAQELKQDTAVTYKRGVMKFFTLLAGKRPSADIIRVWKAELLSNRSSRRR